MARLLLTASRNVRMRALGDVAGHDFHGNQWTSGAGVTDADVADASIAWASKQYPRADLTEKKAVGTVPREKFYKGEVDGLRVSTDIPNTDSIGATFNDLSEYDELPGIREVAIKDLDLGDYAAADDNRRVHELADRIKESGEIKPLIIVVDGTRKPYVLEGGHRAPALALLGKKTLPAVVIVDHTAQKMRAASNPEGINQYTAGGGAGKASRIANDASNKANESGLHLDHLLAAVAHGDAATLHTDPARKAYHQRYVEVHRGKARQVRTAGDVEGHEFHGNQYAGSFPSTVEKIGNELVAQASEHGIEHGALLDSTGKELGRSSGDERSVDYPAGFNKHDETLNGSWHHTHPVEASLSTGDMVSFANTPALKEIYAHTPTMTYKAERVPGKDRELYFAAKDVFGDQHVAALDSFLKHGDEERLRRESFASQHKAMQILHDRGLVKYSYAKRDTLRSAAHHPESAIHAAADAYLRPMTVAVYYALLKGREAYKNGEDAAVEAVQDGLRKSMPSVLLKTLVAGGNAGLSMLPQRRAMEFRALKPPVKKVGPVRIRFDAENEQAALWAEEHAAQLAEGVAATTRTLIQDAVATAHRIGKVGEVYNIVRDAIGDKDRAQLIARTETMTAANEGNRQGWEQAVEEGLLPSNATVSWIATDVGPCPICEALDGTTRTLDGAYDDPEGADGPPAHPNCRCTEGISGF